MNIFCIMGYTASGKDTIVREVADNYNVRKVVPITTRPKREHEANGIDYFFYDEDYFIKELSNLIAVRKFTVWNGSIWSYAFDKRAFNGKDNVIMSTDLTGYKEIKHTFTNDNVVGIFLEAPISVLIKRLEERKTPEEEIMRRLKHDMKKYKNINKENVYTLRNIDLQTTIKKVSKIIDKESKKKVEKAKFKQDKLYLFDIDCYEKDMIKRIKKTKDKESKRNLIKSFAEGKIGFAKELMERKYTFMIANENIGVYSYNGVNHIIIPQWCKECTVEEYGKELGKGDN